MKFMKTIVTLTLLAVIVATGVALRDIHFAIFSLMCFAVGFATSIMWNLKNPKV